MTDPGEGRANRVAVVTGCNRGIGAAIAEALHADGFKVVGVDVVAPEEPAANLATLTVGDIRDPGCRSRAVDSASALGRLDVWVNNAAVAVPGALHAALAEDVELTIGINLMGTYWGCATAVDTFLRQGSPGVIINISSIQAVTPFPGWAAYATAKGGIETLTRYIAVEYGGVGVRAVAVAPGTIATEMFSSVVESTDAFNDQARLQPLGRIGSAAEVARTVAFLASDAASFISGTTVTVDGAATARCFPAPAFGDDHDS